ncbi:serine/threonine-protein kinase [Actinacidiphila yeochonensis]|uniref:serine/threonine-protein kinase n=1 Tax=Actinacidiphila yeochonensis TaxID=89050 RepID=UPI0007C72371|nr:serine/threonine-protein kinase [Actinacidiphila yeochonensis]
MRPVGSKYLLEEPLGRGATGTVWRGRVRDDQGGVVQDTVVAVKVLKEELAGDPDVVTRFLRERSALLRLRHPHIVRVRDLVVEGDLLALVMDLVDGPDLHRYLRENGPFTPVGASLLTAAVADALAASHADGIVHRDLKPANVLLATVAGEDGADRMHPMLTDFGIARLADSPGVTRTQEFVGTPAYIAPESAQGRPQTSAVDVYGAGILLYELVTGQPPFRGESALEVLHAHLTEEPRRPSSVPEPLWTVIERCLRKDPGQRPSAENLARALRVVAGGIGVHASPAAVEAALGVGALLGPAADPAPVPGTGVPAAFGGDAEPTQVLPSGSSAYDPNAPTSAFSSNAAAGAYDPYAATSVLPSSGGGDADRTRVLPSDGAAGGTPPDPHHPWESQLSAARQRNEQTEVRPVDPGLDPLHRPPLRRSQQPQQQPRQAQPPASTTRAARGPSPTATRSRAARTPATATRRSSRRPGGPSRATRSRRSRPPPGRTAPGAPLRAAAAARPAAPEPRAPREPRRTANPMKIPGLGCLKGCLMVILVVIVVFVVVWYTTPLPDWVNSTRNLYDATSDWISSAWDKVSSLTGSGGSSN